MAKTKTKKEDENPELGGGFLSTGDVETINKDVDKRADYKPHAKPGVYPHAVISDIKITKSKSSNQPQVIVSIHVDDQYRDIPVYFTFGPGPEKIGSAKKRFVGFFYSSFEHVFEEIKTKVLSEGITALVNQVEQYKGKEFQEVVKHEQKFFGKLNEDTNQMDVKESFEATHWYSAIVGKEVNFNEARSVIRLSEENALAARERILKSAPRAEGQEVTEDEVPAYLKNEEPPI